MAKLKLATVEAMLLRAEGALALVHKGELEGMDALLMVVCPSEEVELASMLAPKDRKIRALAQSAMKGVGPRKKRSPQLPRRMRQRSVTLDELLLTR